MGLFFIFLTPFFSIPIRRMTQPGKKSKHTTFTTMDYHKRWRRCEWLAMLLALMSYDDDQHQHLSALCHACANRLVVWCKILFIVFLTGQLALAPFFVHVCHKAYCSLQLLVPFPNWSFWQAFWWPIDIDMLFDTYLWKNYICVPHSINIKVTHCANLSDQVNANDNENKFGYHSVKKKALVTVVTVVVARTLCYHMVHFWTHWTTLVIIVLLPCNQDGHIL